MPPRLVSLLVADPPEAWADLGFTVADSGSTVGGVHHELSGGPGKGVLSWSLDGVTLPGGSGDLDGLPTAVAAPPDGDEHPHPNGVVEIDHLVVATPDMDRTVAAFEQAGMRALRRREAEAYGSAMVQTFFRLGPVVLEVVGKPEPQGDGPARFFGLAFTVADLDATAAYFGERLHAPKEAVQPGRRIATLDNTAGTSVAMAFMSPEPEATSAS